jgi:hypothetical protein
MTEPDEDPAIASLLDEAAQLANGFGRVGEASQRFRQAEPKPSCWNEKGSNETQSEIAACNTKRTPHKISRQVSRVLH